MLVLLLGALALWFWHGQVLEHPNRYQLLESSDASKNYYTIAYHVAHDSTYSIFEGMNYPHGEHVIFTDNQPLLSTLMKLVNDHVMEIWGYTVGIVNVLMFLSALVGMYCLFRICQAYQLPAGVSVIFPVLIILLCPQFMRMKEHYALSYMHVLPLAWWLWIKAERGPQLTYGLLLALHLLSASLLHLYYIPIAGGFILLLGMLTLLSDWRKHSWQARGRRLGLLAFQVLLPVLLIKAWLWFSFPVTDRIDAPASGYSASLQSILFPQAFPLGKAISSLFDWQPEHARTNKLAYAGAVAVLAQLGAIIAGLSWAIRKRHWRGLWRPSGWPSLDVAYGAALLMLLMAMRTDVWLLDLLGLPGDLLQHFRFRQRLAWPFFFVANIGALVLIQRTPWASISLPSGLKRRQLAGQWPLFLVAAGILGFEGAWFQSQHMEMEPTGNPFRPGSPTFQALQELPIQRSRYQALIPVPYFHGGAEAVGIWPPGATTDSRITQLPEAFSLAKGLPMTAVVLSRTSLSQTRQNIQLVKSSAFGKRMIERLPSAGPFLMFENTELTENFHNDDLFQKARTLPTSLSLPSSNVRFREIKPAGFRQIRQHQHRVAQDFCKRLPARLAPFQLLSLYGGPKPADSAQASLRHEGAAGNGLSKASARRFRPGQSNVSLRRTLPRDWPPGDSAAPAVHLSFWAQVDVANANYAVRFLDAEGNPVGSEHWYNYSQNLMQVWKEWQLYDWLERPPKGAREIELWHYVVDGSIWVNNVLIWPPGPGLFWHDGNGGLFWNNRYYEAACRGTALTGEG